MEAKLTDAQLSKALGDYTVLHLKIYADGLTSMVDEDMASSQAAFEVLRKALKELYPSEKMISFDFRER